MAVFTKSATDRLEELRLINRSVLGDPALAERLRYGGISLWACEQQLLWEQLGREPFKGGPRSFVAGFLGRLLAYASLVLLVIRMRVSRARILVYGIDLVDSPYRADSRIAGIYRFLEERKIGYGEIFHTPFGRDFFANMLRRRRPAFYLDPAHGKSPPVPLPSGLPAAAVRRLRAALSRPRRIAFLRRMLALTGARAILAIDDTRHYYPLMIAAKESGIPFYAFQHGRINRFMAGLAQHGMAPDTCPLPDAVFVWNGYWRKALLATSPAAALHPDRVRIAGRPDARMLPVLGRPADDGVITVLLPHEEGVAETDLLDLITRLLADPDIRIICKLRRGRAKPLFVPRIAANPAFESRFDVGPDEWSRTDAVVGAYSTFLYEAAAMGRPVGILETDVTQASDLAECGIAGTVRMESAAEDVRRLAGMPWDAVCVHRRVFESTASFNEVLSAIISL